MTPSASAAAWRPRARNRWVALASRLSCCWGSGALASQYLAGFLFLQWLHSDSEDGDAADGRALRLLLRRAAGYPPQAAGDFRPRVSRWSCSPVILALRNAARGSLHGDARFATRREIATGGALLGGHGIILGRIGRRCLMLAGQQGVALAAPPRAGKGTGVVVPNLLNWPDSVICIDIKRENWTLTAGFRKAAGQACFLFDPFAEDGATARWNPFFYVSADPMRRVNDLQRIAEMLYPDPPNVDPFWTASARSLFLGIALYLFETPSMPKTIGEVLRQGMASDDEGFGAHWKRVIEGRNSGRIHCPRSACARCTT